ncbi:MAG: XdhC family protein [Rhodomicrobium sp.]
MTADPDETVESYCRNWDGAAPYARATIVRTEGATAAKAGAKAIVTASGELIGWIGGGCLRSAVLRAGQQAIAAAEPRLIRVRPKELVTSSADTDGVEVHPSSCPSKGSTEVFIEPVMPKRPLVIIGASYVAKALAELAATLSFELVQMAGAPASDAVFPLSALPRLAGLDRAFIVVATQGSGDYAALSAAMATGAPYVAFVASVQKAAAMRERLAKDGIDHAGRLHAPAGLDIGSETPAEIAVAILAEIVSMRRAGPKGSRI